LTTRRLLSVFGLAYLSELEAEKRQVDTQRTLKYAAQDALDAGKRQWRHEREQFRKALNIRGIAMQQFYRVSAEKAEPSPEFVDITRFRILLNPMHYFAEFATIEDPKIYKIPAVARMFAEDTAHKFAEHILKEMPAEIVKQLEAQV
jgi:hypothetical protein